jgi:hypothetical protein
VRESCAHATDWNSILRPIDYAHAEQARSHEDLVRIERKEIERLFTQEGTPAFLGSFADFALATVQLGGADCPL